MTDEEIRKNAAEYVKSHKADMFEGLVAGKDFSSVNRPVAIFMAGTPGAGKTEVSKWLLSLFSPEPIRIDADELRELLPGYNGSNSHVVQSAATIAVEKMLDQTYAKKFSFILDATFAYKNAAMNLKRAVRRGYATQIYFIYQNPVDAWNFTKAREKKEGRHVPKEAFINAYFASRENVKNVKKEFGDEVLLTLIVRNYTTGESVIHDDVDDIESYLPKDYTKQALEELLQ